VPALVSTLSICIVFVPMFLLTGVARYLFVPMAEALSSQCWLPTCFRGLSCRPWPSISSKLMLKKARTPPARILLCCFKRGLNATLRGFAPHIAGYSSLVSVTAAFLPVPFSPCAYSPSGFTLGWDKTSSHRDSGEFTLHLRAPTGLRIEETAALCDRVEAEIRNQIPPAEFSGVIDNIGLPYSGINLSYSNSAPVEPLTADIMVALSPKHRPTAGYVHDLRLKLAQDFS